MGHKDKASTNYSGGDSPKRLYLSPSTRTISPGIKVLPYAIAIFGVAFLVSAITASIVTPVKNSNAISSGINADINPVAYYVNITTSGTVSKDIQATYAGTRAVQADMLTVRSNTPTGYKVYVSMANNNNGQRLPQATGEDPNTHEETYSSTYYLDAISGNGAVDDLSPASLSNPGTLRTANTWGIAIPGNLATLKQDDNFTVPAGYSDQSAYTATSITDAVRFAPVPVSGSEQLLYSYNDDTTVTGADTNPAIATLHEVPVYYGFYATSGLPSGTYKNTVRYTAYAESASNPTAAATAGTVANYTDSNTTLRFVTSLYTDRTITPEQVTVTIGNRQCTNKVISKVNAGTNDSVVVTCTAPAQPGPGNYTATISIPDYAHTSSTTVSYGGMAALVATIDGIHYAINTMQDFADPAGDGSVTGAQICEAWDGGLANDSNWDSANNKPKAFTTNIQKPNYIYGDSVGFDPLLDPSHASSTVTDAVVIDDPTNSNYFEIRRSARINNINAVVPEARLRDTRDDNYYRIRKLADGNCWMTENLRLVFSNDETAESNGIRVGTVANDGMTITHNGNYITPENTNVTAEQLEAWKPLVAYTETGFVNGVVTGTKGAQTQGQGYTVWGASDGDTVKHSTQMSHAEDSPENSAKSTAFSRSFYADTTRSNCYLGLNNLDAGASTLLTDNCFIGDNDEQTVGTYYNYTAATAGTGKAATIGNATGSICPSGWRLPGGNIGEEKSWYELTQTTYGGGAYASNNLYGVIEGDIRKRDASAMTGGAYHSWALTAAIRMAPLSLPFSGVFTYHTAEVYNFTITGYWWSNRKPATSTANYLYVASGYFFSRNTSSRGFGRSVRCVAQ